MNTVHLRQPVDLHVTPGRVRVRSLAMKRDAARARRAEQDLAALPGITLARINPTTGSILLHFDTAAWTADRLLSLLSERGYVEVKPAQPNRPVSARRDRDLLTTCCALIGKELLCAAIRQAFPHPVLDVLLVVV